MFLFVSPDKQLLSTFKIGNSYSLQKFDIIYDFILIYDVSFISKADFGQIRYQRSFLVFVSTSSEIDNLQK